MGFIVGAGLLSHAPVIMLPEAQRRAVNGGQDYTLASGLTDLGRSVFDRDAYDAVIVIDSHWTTTTETVVTSHAERTGVFTSSEMPALLARVPFVIQGDPALAHEVAKAPYAVAVDDPYLPMQYATLNLWTYLGRPNRPWISISVCQTATTDDFLRLGESIAIAAARLERRVLLIASGGLSHRFLPLSELRHRMQADPANIVSDAARDADLKRIAWLTEGDHAAVIRAMPDYAQYEPEARFGHYLVLAGALGGVRCTTPGVRWSAYESGIGTGQAHLWFSP